MYKKMMNSDGLEPVAMAFPARHVRPKMIEDEKTPANLTIERRWNNV